MTLVDILALLYENKFFNEIWVLYFFLTLHKSVVKAKHPYVKTFKSQEVCQTCQMI